MNFKDTANNWKPAPKIADLPRIDINTEIFTDGEGVSPETDKAYRYSYIIVDNKEIRVPESVISQLKEHLESNPSMTAFRVVKKGEGILSKYTVIPII